jgi:glucuronosyltransferase
LGVAVKVSYIWFSKNAFKEAVRSILENPTYKDKAELISKRFRDQPERPLERAIWWVKYVLRNPNPDHLRSPTLKLGYFVSNGYDVFCFVGAIIGLIIYFILKLTFYLMKPKKHIKKNKKFD